MLVYQPLHAPGGGLLPTRGGYGPVTWWSELAVAILEEIDG